MRVFKTYIVKAEMGVTTMYLLEDGRYMVDFPCAVNAAAGIWVDDFRFVSHQQALDLLNATTEFFPKVTDGDSSNCIIEPQRTQAGYDSARETILDKCKFIPSSRETLDWNLDDFEIVSYACGDKLDKNKNLTFDHFEFAYPMKMSNNVNDRKEFYHFFCTSKCQETFVVARRKQVTN